MAGYKCTSIGCYSFEDPTKNLQIKQLQDLVNRFMPLVHLTPMAVDGIVGKGTTSGIITALGYIVEKQMLVAPLAHELVLQINKPEDIVGDRLLGLVTLFSSAAGGLGLKAVAPAQKSAPRSPPQPTSAEGQARLAAATAGKAALKPKWYDKFPPWAPYAGGAVIALGTLGMVIATSRKRKVGSLSPASTAAVGRWR